MKKVKSNITKSFDAKRGLRGTYEHRTSKYNQTDVSETEGGMADGGSIFDRERQLAEQEEQAGLTIPDQSPQPTVSPLPSNESTAGTQNIVSQGIDAAYQGWKGFNDALSLKLGSWGFAQGGKKGLRTHVGPGAVEGPGGPREDKVPAMYSDGEYVLPAKTVEALGGAAALDQVVKETNDGREPLGAKERAAGGPLRAARGMTPDDLDYVIDETGVRQPKAAMANQLAQDFEGAKPRLPAQQAIEAAARRPVPTPMTLETDAAAANRIAAANQPAGASPIRAPNFTTSPGAGGPYAQPAGPAAPQAPAWTTSPGAAGPAAAAPGQAAGRMAQAAEVAKGLGGKVLDKAKAAPKAAVRGALRAAPHVAIGAGLTSIPESFRTSTEDMAKESGNLGERWLDRDREFGMMDLNPIGLAGRLIDATLPEDAEGARRLLRDTADRTAGTVRRFANAATFGGSEQAATALGATPLGTPARAPAPAPEAPAAAPEAAQPEDPFAAQAAGDRLADRSVAALRRGPGGEALPTQFNADMLSQAQAFRGSPIRAQISESGNMEFSGSGPSNRVYTGVDGQPVTRYEDSAQFAEGTQRAAGEAAQLDGLIQARLASGNRDDIEQANQLAVTPAQKAAVNAAFGKSNETDRRRRLPLRERMALEQQDTARAEGAANRGLRQQEIDQTGRNQRADLRMKAATLESNARNRQEDNARADTAAAEARDTKVGSETDEFVKGSYVTDGKPDTAKQEAFRRYASMAGADLGAGKTRAERDVMRGNLRTAFEVQEAINETGGEFGASTGEGPDPILEVRKVRASDSVSGGTEISKNIKARLPWANDTVVVTKSGQVRRIADIAVGPDGQYNRDRLALIARAAKVPEKDLKALDTFHLSR